MTAMRCIDLRTTTNVVICHEPDGARGRHMSALMARHGLPFRFETGLYRKDGKPSLPKTADLTLNFVKAAYENRRSLPLLLLEDDCDTTEAFAPEIEVPADADVVYLGVSRWGLVPEVLEKGIIGTILSREWGPDHVRLYNMLQTHAVLFVTQRGLERGLMAGLDALFGDRAHDVRLALAQRGMVTVAPRRPLFFQTDALQAGTRRDFLRQEANSRIEIRPPAAANLLLIRFEGEDHLLRLGVDAGGHPHWVRVEEFPTGPGFRTLRVSVELRAGGQAVWCEQF